MVTKGYTSGYSAWIQMKKENESVMAYKNIGRRVLILHKHGYLEEVNLENAKNLHGRKDYKVTRKGQHALVNSATSAIKSTNQYIRSIENLDSLPIDIEQITDLQRSMTELNIRLMRIQRVNVVRSKRQLLAQQQLVGSTIKTERIKTETDHDQEFTTVTPSKELVEFQRRQRKQREEQHKPVTTAAIPKKKH